MSLDEGEVLLPAMSHLCRGRSGPDCPHCRENPLAPSDKYRWNSPPHDCWDKESQLVPRQYLDPPVDSHDEAPEFFLPQPSLSVPQVTVVEERLLGPPQEAPYQREVAAREHAEQYRDAPGGIGRAQRLAPAATTAGVHGLTKLVDYYKEHGEGFIDAEFVPQTVSSDPAFWYPL